MLLIFTPLCLLDESRINAFGDKLPYLECIAIFAKSVDHRFKTIVIFLKALFLFFMGLLLFFSH